MKKIDRRTALLAAGAALALSLSAAGCSRHSDGRTIAISDAWVRMPAVKGEPGAAYFRLEGGSEGTKLLGVSSPLVRRIELHESMTKSGRTSMKAMKDVDFPYDRRLVFEPGGRHAMLFGLSPEVKPGGKLPLTFAFNNAPPLTLDVEVRDAAGMAHGGH